jgi:ABC-type dipeptide/oligopeptide/nickel transport system ATPase component
MRAMAHRVIVMKAGRVVEEGDTLDVLHAPSHPYRGRCSRRRCSHRIRNLNQSGGRECK